jgi:Do/DeqQ family serine protease
MAPFRSLLVLCLLATAAQASEPAVPASREQIRLSYAPVVRQVSPAVVNIYTKTRVTVQENLSPFANDPFFQQFFGRNMPGFSMGGRTREQVVSSLGSGVIVKPDGTIVTSHHVVKNAQEITVVLADKREFEARVTLRDQQSDLAFLKIEIPENKQFPPFSYLRMRDTGSLEVGELVLAIGNPFGVGQTVTSGIISALSREARGVSDYQFFIQTDAAINPGNSGGALVDMDGRLIGINTAIYSNSGGSLGIGFAIPADMVKSLMDGKVSGGKVVRPWLGVSVQPVTAEVAESLGLAAPQGVMVRNVTPGSPVEKAGLQAGDLVLAVGGVEVSSEQEMRYRVALAKLGDTSDFEVLRKGEKLKLAVKMEAPAEIPARDQRELKGNHPLSGVVVANLSPALAMELEMEDAARTGVVVMNVTPNSVAARVAVRPGDVLLEINGQKVSSTKQLESLLKNAARNWKIVYQQGGNILTLTVKQ